MNIERSHMGCVSAPCESQSWAGNPGTPKGFAQREWKIEKLPPKSWLASLYRFEGTSKGMPSR